MMNEDELYDEVDRFLSDELSEEALSDFNKKLGSDKDLQEELALQKDLVAYLENEKYIRLDQQLDGIGDEFVQAYPQKNPSKKRWGLLVAIIVLIGLGLYFYFFTTPTVSNEQLFAEYYALYIPDETERSNTAIISSMSIAIQAYEDKNYDQAIDELNTIIAIQNIEVDDDAKANFFLGLSYLEKDNLSKAKETFIEVTRANSMLYQQEAYWYLSLIAIQENDIPMTQNYLNELLQISDRGKYANQAKELLEKL